MKKILQSIGIIIGCLLMWALGGIMMIVVLCAEGNQIEMIVEIVFYACGTFFLAVFAIFAHLAISDIYE